MWKRDEVEKYWTWDYEADIEPCTVNLVYRYWAGETRCKWPGKKRRTDCTRRYSLPNGNYCTKRATKGERHILTGCKLCCDTTRGRGQESMWPWHNNRIAHLFQNDPPPQVWLAAGTSDGGGGGHAEHQGVSSLPAHHDQVAKDLGKRHNDHLSDEKVDANSSARSFWCALLFSTPVPCSIIINSKI